jgi:hypothetical protein
LFLHLLPSTHCFCGNSPLHHLISWLLFCFVGTTACPFQYTVLGWLTSNFSSKLGLTRKSALKMWCHSHLSYFAIIEGVSTAVRLVPCKAWRWCQH